MGFHEVSAQVAMMMEPRLQGVHFIIYLATRQGTARGGMDLMYKAVQQDQQATAATACCAAPSTASLGLEVCNAQAGELVGPAESVPPAHATDAGADSNRVSKAAKAMSAVADLQQTLERLRGTISEGDTFWRLAEMQIRKCALSAVQKEAEGPSGRDTAPLAAQLGFNPDAPEGWSLARRRNPLERGRKNRSKGKGKESMAAQSPEQAAGDKAVPFPAAQKSKQLPVLLDAIQNQTAGQRRLAVAAEQQAKKRAAATYAQIAAHAAVPADQLRATQLQEAAAKHARALAMANTGGVQASTALPAKSLGLPPIAAPLMQPLLPAGPLPAVATLRGPQMRQTGDRSGPSSPMPAARADMMPLTSSTALGTSCAASVETKSGRSIKRPTRFD